MLDLETTHMQLAVDSNLNLAIVKDVKHESKLNRYQPNQAKNGESLSASNHKTVTANIESVVCSLQLPVTPPGYSAIHLHLRLYTLRLPRPHGQEQRRVR